mgnify:FL=1
MLKRILFTFLLITFLNSCSDSDDGVSSQQGGETTAEITLKDASGDTVSGIVVYAYNEESWDLFGDDTQFADHQAASNDNGIASFNLSSNLDFSELNNFTQTFRFSVHYSINDVNETKVKAITFEEGDSKSETIILD